MTEDILQSTAEKRPETPKDTWKKKKVSALGVIFTIVLAIVLILLGERIIFDLNKVANPVVEKSYTTTRNYNYLPSATYGLSSEKSGLSSSTVYYPTEKKGEYFTYKLLIHAAFIIPIFLLTFLFYYLFSVKKMYSHFQVVMYGYLAFAFWMLLHLLVDLIRFIMEEFANSAIYIILVIMVVIFTALAVFIQKKVVAKA